LPTYILPDQRFDVTDANRREMAMMMILHTACRRHIIRTVHGSKHRVRVFIVRALHEWTWIVESDELLYTTAVRCGHL
jgi:hypothetical protein